MTITVDLEKNRYHIPIVRGGLQKANTWLNLVSLPHMPRRLPPAVPAR